MKNYQSFIFQEKKEGKKIIIIDKSKIYYCKEIILQNYENQQNPNYKEYFVISNEEIEKIFRVVEFFSNKKEIKKQIEFIEKKSQFNSLWYKLSIEIDESSKIVDHNILLTPIDQYNFKSIVESKEVSQDLYLKAMFHLILGLYDIGENESSDDSMFFSFLNCSFENLYLFSFQEFMLLYPFIKFESDDNISEPFFKSISKYIDFNYCDSLLTDIINKMNNQPLSKIHFLFVVKKIIKIILKEKDRILDQYPNSKFSEYFEQFEVSIYFEEQRDIKLNINNKIDPFKVIKMSSFLKNSKNNSGVLYIVNHKGKELGVEIFKNNENNEIDISKTGINNSLVWKCLPDNFLKFFDYSKDKEKMMLYIIYELPIGFDFNSCYENSILTNNMSKQEKDQLFYRLINKRLSNYGYAQFQNKQIGNGIDILNNYSNLIISNKEKIYYSYSFDKRAKNSLINSVYDIGKFVYGKNSTELKQLQCLKLLQHLVWYNNVQSIHHQINISISNIYKIIRNNLDGSKKFIEKYKPFEYPIIIIGENFYYIKKISSPLEKSCDFYKTMILILKGTNNKRKFVCVRKQFNLQLFCDVALTSEFIPGKDVEFLNVCGPLFAINDSNTSFTFFKYKPIVTLQQFNLKLGHVVILRSLLIYLQNLNFIDGNFLQNDQVLINISKISKFGNDVYFLVDIREFAEKFFKNFFGWNEAILNTKELITKYVYLNESLVKSDQFCYDLFDQLFN